ncbi:MAG: 23S rRNA (adenine(2030)-N(6))-methyltransferase RlmJ, partial [Burkholderiaceae bacterium]
GIRRFATGTFAVWYPLVQRREVQTMVRGLKQLPTPWLNVSLTVQKPSSDGFGLYGSGMFILNPPWTLHAALTPALPWLRDTLKQDSRASFTLEQQAN